jgi:hypothetical protein
MIGSSIKNSNSNVEVTISQNPLEALRNDRSVAQTSHKGLIKNTGITGRGEGLLCQGLSLDEAQALFNANDCVSEAGREVIDASATRTNTGVSITNDNEDVDLKLHNSPMTSGRSYPIHYSMRAFCPVIIVSSIQCGQPVQLSSQSGQLVRIACPQTVGFSCIFGFFII